MSYDIIPIDRELEVANFLQPSPCSAVRKAVAIYGAMHAAGGTPEELEQLRMNALMSAHALESIRTGLSTKSLQKMKNELAEVTALLKHEDPMQALTSARGLKKPLLSAQPHQRMGVTTSPQMRSLMLEVCAKAARLDNPADVAHVMMQTRDALQGRPVDRGQAFDRMQTPEQIDEFVRTYVALPWLDEAASAIAVARYSHVDDALQTIFREALSTEQAAMERFRRFRPPAATSVQSVCQRVRRLIEQHSITARQNPSVKIHVDASTMKEFALLLPEKPEGRIHTVSGASTFQLSLQVEFGERPVNGAAGGGYLPVTLLHEYDHIPESAAGHKQLLSHFAGTAQTLRAETSCDTLDRDARPARAPSVGTLVYLQEQGICDHGDTLWRPRGAQDKLPTVAMDLICAGCARLFGVVGFDEILPRHTLSTDRGMQMLEVIRMRRPEKTQRAAMTLDQWRDQLLPQANASRTARRPRVRA